MMESTTMVDSTHRVGKMKRRSFFGYAVAGGVGTFSLRGLMSRFVRSSQSSDAKPQITVSINPFAVPRTRKSSTTNG
jgi:hypothetical protein